MDALKRISKGARGRFSETKRNSGPNQSHEATVSPKVSPQDANKQLYRALDSQKKEIRLLEVEPGAKHTPVKCTLHYAFLTKWFRKPVYETISYVWGDKTERATIYLHGNPKDVPASTEDALRRMRLPNKKRVIWIDSVCINQENLIERGQQVAFMHEIYGHGVQNLVWLGRDDGFTEAALIDIKGLANELRVLTNGFKDAKTTLFDSEFRPRLQDEPTTYEVHDWDALAQFYNSAWFSRLWVVQEATFASKTLCYRGDHEMPLEDVCRAAYALFCIPRYFHSVVYELHRAMNRVAVLTQYADHVCGRHVVSRGSSIDVLTMLIDLQDFNAEDPRDHIFGILGLLHRFTPSEELTATLKPDYQARLADVCRNATGFIVNHSDNLKVLGHSFRRVEDTDAEWPSWVPRWHRSLDYNKDPTALDSNRYTADNGIRRQPERPWTQGNDFLTLKGLIVDTVEEVGFRFSVYGVTDDAEDIADLMIAAETMVTTTRHRDEEEPVKAVASVLIAGSGGWQLGRLSETECFAMYNALREYLKAGEPLPDAGRERYLGTSFQDDEKAKKADLYRGALMDRRCLFSTTSGYFGAGAEIMQPGDIVAIVYGSSAPYILRPLSPDGNDSTYELIGDCYAHGIMDGEFVQANREEGGANDITFRIQ